MAERKKPPLLGDDKGSSVETIPLNAIPPNSWGQIIKRARGTLSQREVIESIRKTGTKFSQSMLSSWENGSRNPRVYSTAFKSLLEVLGLLEPNGEVSAALLRTEKTVGNARTYDPSNRSLDDAQATLQETIDNRGSAEIWLFGAKDFPVVHDGRVREFWTKNLLQGVNYNIVWFVDKVGNRYFEIHYALRTVIETTLSKIDSIGLHNVGQIKHYFVNLNDSTDADFSALIDAINSVTRAVSGAALDISGSINRIGPELKAHTPDMNFSKRFSGTHEVIKNSSKNALAPIGLSLKLNTISCSHNLTFEESVWSQHTQESKWLIEWMAVRDIWTEEWSPGSSIIIYDLKDNYKKNYLGFEQVFLRDSGDPRVKGKPRLVTLTPSTCDILRDTTWKFTKLIDDIQKNAKPDSTSIPEKPSGDLHANS